MKNKIVSFLIWFKQGTQLSKKNDFKRVDLDCSQPKEGIQT
jgi:hypothetical protein